MIKLTDILKQLKNEGSLPVTVDKVSQLKSVTISDTEPEDVQDFWLHHHLHPGTTDSPAEPDTYDWDDDTESDPGLQFDDGNDDAGAGYEPV